MLILELLAIPLLVGALAWLFGVASEGVQRPGNRQRK